MNNPKNNTTESNIGAKIWKFTKFGIMLAVVIVVGYYFFFAPPK